MSVIRPAVLMLGFLGGMIARPAAAATSEGSLITNIACATFTLSLSTGPQTVISYCATSVVQVATPCLMLRKSGNTTIQAAGGTVTFCITFSNCSDWASAMNVVITDVVPDNTRYVNTFANQVFEPEGSVVTTAWSSNGGTSWTSGAGATGYPAATYNPLMLKWTVDTLGPGASGYVCYTVSIL